MGVPPQMDTSIQIGPTGRKLLPLTVENAAPTPASSSHAHFVCCGVGHWLGVQACSVGRTSSSATATCRGRVTT
ncbi:hypothetical protein BOG92_041240 [Streptomyces sp. WAC00263]|nr:hypothetical protein BOG92_041240 [Streptomyces sp. WAC00263]